jgi:hypothetical protein
MELWKLVLVLYVVVMFVYFVYTKTSNTKSPSAYLEAYFNK